MHILVRVVCHAVLNCIIHSQTFHLSWHAYVPSLRGCCFFHLILNPAFIHAGFHFFFIFKFHNLTILSSMGLCSADHNVFTFYMVLMKSVSFKYVHHSTWAVWFCGICLCIRGQSHMEYCLWYVLGCLKIANVICLYKDN